MLVVQLMLWQVLERSLLMCQGGSMQSSDLRGEVQYRKPEAELTRTQP